MLSACALPEQPPSLDSTSGIARAAALSKVSGPLRDADRRRLIGLLLSPDPAERMFAAATLERVGQPMMGYHAQDPEAERVIAVERMLSALEHGGTDDRLR